MEGRSKVLPTIRVSNPGRLPNGILRIIILTLSEVGLTLHLGIQYGKDAQAFKISTPPRYLVVFPDPKKIKELADAGDSVMSFGAATREVIATPIVVN